MQSYISVDKQLHFLSQVMAKANRSFLPKKEDDSHTNLYFDALAKRITGRWLKADAEQLLFTLNLNNLKFEVLNVRQEVLTSVTSLGKTRPQIEAEIAEELPALGLPKKGFEEPMHYQIPDYDFAEGALKNPANEAVEEWCYYRNLANEACTLLLGHTQKTADTRIWPHHFDTGIYFQCHSKLALGFGLAMADGVSGSPYFYLSGNALKGKLTYQNLPKADAWHFKVTDNWQGAVLPLSSLSARTKEEAKQILANYLAEAFSWFIKQ